MPHLPWLAGNSTAFPATANALSSPNGLLAAGGDLSPERLLSAYQHGIFPWYEQGQPILWWTPDPRMVIFPEHIHCSRTMAKWLKKCPWELVLDRDFDQVVAACAAPRSYAEDTWITPEMHLAYTRLHQSGLAHCIAVYEDDALVGGLYGVALGNVFFGESMFSRRANASKTALIALSRWLAAAGFALIDCQVENPHLVSLGAKNVPRATFEHILELNATDRLIHSRMKFWQNARERAITPNGSFKH